MWTRAQLKSNAKIVLKKSYWPSFFITLVFGAMASACNGVIAVTGVVGVLINFFVICPLMVGINRFFLECTQFRVDIGEMIFPFKNGQDNYFNIVMVQFFRWLFIFLWSLLLIIPGIVKRYAYRMVPYILSENPGMPYRRALQLSEDMMRGHKFDALVLDFSFLGWYFLGILCLGIGVLFVRPYVSATDAQLYLALRTIALDKGMVQIEELDSRCESQI